MLSIRTPRCRSSRSPTSSAAISSSPRKASATTTARAPTCGVLSRILMRRCNTFVAIVMATGTALSAVALAKAEQGKPANYKGLEITVSSIERAATVGLRDCPPGSNTVRGLTKPGEEFAIVNLSFRVTPAFKETIVKKPVLLDASGKTFNTAMSFVDPGATPEYSCGFAYRVPEGTKLVKIQIDTATLDLTAFDKK